MNPIKDKQRQLKPGSHKFPSRWRKRPVEIEAIRWCGDNLREVIAFTGRHQSAQDWTWEHFEAVVAADGLKIFTLEGAMMASVGDWIIKGVHGEVYPCKPEIFAKTYESALSASSSCAAHTPEKLLDVAKHTLLPRDPLKLAALRALIAALELPDNVPPETLDGEPVKASAVPECATCEDKPEVCATVPGLRHCEAAQRSATTPTLRDKYIAAFIGTAAGPAFSRDEIRKEALAIVEGRGPYAPVSSSTDTAALAECLKKLESEADGSWTPAAVQALAMAKSCLDGITRSATRTPKGE